MQTKVQQQENRKVGNGIVKRKQKNVLVTRTMSVSNHTKSSEKFQLSPSNSPPITSSLFKSSNLVTPTSKPEGSLNQTPSDHPSDILPLHHVHWGSVARFDQIGTYTRGHAIITSKVTISHTSQYKPQKGGGVGGEASRSMECDKNNM